MAENFTTTNAYGIYVAFVKEDRRSQALELLEQSGMAFRRQGVIDGYYIDCGEPLSAAPLQDDEDGKFELCLASADPKEIHRAILLLREKMRLSHVDLYALPYPTWCYPTFALTEVNASVRNIGSNPFADLDKIRERFTAYAETFGDQDLFTADPIQDAVLESSSVSEGVAYPADTDGDAEIPDSADANPTYTLRFAFPDGRGSKRNVRNIRAAIEREGFDVNIERRKPKGDKGYTVISIAVPANNRAFPEQLAEGLVTAGLWDGLIPASGTQSGVLDESRKLVVTPPKGSNPDTFGSLFDDVNAFIARVEDQNAQSQPASSADPDAAVESNQPKKKGGFFRWLRKQVGRVKAALSGKKKAVVTNTAAEDDPYAVLRDPEVQDVLVVQAGIREKTVADSTHRETLEAIAKTYKVRRASITSAYEENVARHRSNGGLSDFLTVERARRLGALGLRKKAAEAEAEKNYRTQVVEPRLRADLRGETLKVLAAHVTIADQQKTIERQEEEIAALKAQLAPSSEPTPTAEVPPSRSHRGTAAPVP